MCSTDAESYALNHIKEYELHAFTCGVCRERE